ncbi:MAG: EutN/CcmL family microcompartment protein [Kiritimatiellae bacterium]|jgi:ethanolamine utilization protein EutN|nr:EutN/CcmL family microcompartment protein [Kiritimatiellia bacterium]MDY0150459.1 EutN/CcmL family microcompartment protein [Kiritimatiellia bacterium]
MILGNVIGNIHSTIRHPFYDHRKLLIVEQIKPDGTITDDYLVAIDCVGAGPGETVLVLNEGNGGRQILESKNGPVRSVIVGIVDTIIEENTP